jgi:hypothetical protein
MTALAAGKQVRKGLAMVQHIWVILSGVSLYEPGVTLVDILRHNVFLRRQQ